MRPSHRCHVSTWTHQRWKITPWTGRENRTLKKQPANLCAKHREYEKEKTKFTGNQALPDRIRLTCVSLQSLNGPHTPLTHLYWSCRCMFMGAKRAHACFWGKPGMKRTCQLQIETPVGNHILFSCAKPLLTCASRKLLRMLQYFYKDEFIFLWYRRT